MPRESKRSPHARTRMVGVEVHIYRGGYPYRRVRVRRSPATIGRDPAASIQLDSGHVSRRHAELHFDEKGMRLVDAGSRNGFLVRGERLTQAGITAEEKITVCDFELTFRPLVRKMEPFEADLSAGWADFEDEEGEPDTGVHPIPAPVSADSMPKTPTRAAESMVEEPPELSALIGEELDPEELDEFVAPDLPPLLATMQEEAKALLYNNQQARVGVEVILTVGGRVFDVDLLSAGESCWWGGKPRGLGLLLVAPTEERFPIVTHARHGEYRVQVPASGRWKLLHRGSRQVDTHRSGPFMGCKAELRDQIEISHGAFTIFVRSVRVPPRGNTPLTWNSLAPDRMLLAALLFSLGIHTGAMAIPIQGLPKLSFRLPYSDSFVEVDMLPGEVRPASPEPTPQLREPPPALEKLPIRPVAASSKPPTRPRRTTQRVEVETAATDAGAAETKRVSVSDFRISGMIAHLPTPHIDQPGSALRGGASIVRGGRAGGPGIVSKQPSRLRLTPKGRLAPETVRRVVNQNAQEIERCYNASLAHGRGLEGRLEVEWVVERVGTVSNTRVIYDEVGSDILARCLRATIKSWVFPPPGGGTARVSFPFVFSNLRR